jgi:hypothetical protein
MVHGIHHWNYLGFSVDFFNGIHVDPSMDMLSYGAKTPLNINGITLKHQWYNILSIKSFHFFNFLLLLREFCSPLDIDGHGSINCMWVLHILIESSTYIQLIVSKRIRNYNFYISLDSHKIVAWLFLPFVNYCFFMGCGKVHS